MRPARSSRRLAAAALVNTGHQDVKSVPSAGAQTWHDFPATSP